LEMGSQIGIASSGIIDVIEGTRSDGEEDGGDEEEDEDDDEGDEDEGEGELYNTYNEPYRKRLSDGDSITVSS
jgi:hypothetical protein